VSDVAGPTPEGARSYNAERILDGLAFLLMGGFLALGASVAPRTLSEGGWAAPRALVVIAAVLAAGLFALGLGLVLSARRPR
jgi:hypothetical protein